MFHVWWPALTALALFVVIAMVLILRYSDRLCNARQTTLSTSGPYPVGNVHDDLEMMTYDHSIEREYSV